MTQQHGDGVLPECRLQFDLQSQTSDRIFRQLEKINEHVGQLLTDNAVMQESVNNHQQSLQDSIVSQEARFNTDLSAQETRIQLSVSRMWKVLIALLLGIGIGGGGAAVNQWVF